MHEIQLTADQLITRLLHLSKTEPVCILDSCGVGHLGSHLLLAGLRPIKSTQLTNDDVLSTLKMLDERLSGPHAAIFTLSYDFGCKLQQIPSKWAGEAIEPDVFLSLFESLIFHDYATGKSFISEPSAAVLQQLSETVDDLHSSSPSSAGPIVSDFTNAEYIAAVEDIREYIRRGDTYQTNLTQQFQCLLPDGIDAQTVFRRLRQDHPAPFASFITRGSSVVVSASPERFFRVDRDGFIEASPIKGTRARGDSAEADGALKRELESSVKDRAENTMIVDLMRNDLGRVCEFGSVEVMKLCDIEEHPTLFHLVSTVRGKLRDGAFFSDILRSLFPCGSITGAPKIRTMRIIDEIEHSQRGLSMGAIGVYIPPDWDRSPIRFDTVFDLSVAIRTMIISQRKAVFNVGGGVVIDSDPQKEYDESLLKAKALLQALGAST